MLQITQGDITTLDVECIVNAANPSLLGGGGVDGAIHKAAGPKLLQECKKLGGAKRGEAKITHGYELKAKWIIHTVGPIYQGGNHNEDVILQRCYENSLCLARSYGIKSIAFPSISTGVYQYPIQKASFVALQTITWFLQKCSFYEMKVICILHSQKDYEIYIQNAKKLGINFTT